MSDDTGDITLHKIDKRLRDVEVWLKLHEREHESVDEKINSAAKHSLETDSKCLEISAYLDERKLMRQRQQNLLADVKKWVVIMMLGWMIMLFADGMRQRVLAWLTQS